MIAKRAVSAFLYEPRLAHVFMRLEAHTSIHSPLTPLPRQNRQEREEEEDLFAQVEADEWGKRLARR